jgi:HAE1 family hydrophobic/amphiphilic exporter-1
MRTLAVIFGMMPLGMAVSGGGAQRAPMAHAIIGRLISSTLLTLIVVPMILSYIDGMTQRLARFMLKAPDDHEVRTVQLSTHAVRTPSGHTILPTVQRYRKRERLRAS